VMMASIADSTIAVNHDASPPRRAPARIRGIRFRVLIHSVYPNLQAAMRRAAPARNRAGMTGIGDARAQSAGFH